MRTLLAVFAVLSVVGCAGLPQYDAKPEVAKAEGYFVSHDDTVARNSVGNYVFRKGMSKPAMVSAPAADQIAVAQAAPAPISEMPEVSVYFEIGKSDLSQAAKAELKKMAAVSKSSKIIVVGSTDPTGTVALNKALSKRRAQVVKNYMVSTLKMPASKIEAIGMGVMQNEAYPQARRASVAAK